MAVSIPSKISLPGGEKKGSYSGAKRGQKATEAERETVHGTMSVDSAVWEFIQACERWKIENNRKYVPQSILFQIMLGLGYRKLGSAYKVCESCGCFFTPREKESTRGWKARKYCSPKCSKLVGVSDEHKPVKVKKVAPKWWENTHKKCLVCGNLFYPTPSHRKDKKKWESKKTCNRWCTDRICQDGSIWTDKEIDIVADRYPLIGSKVLPEINKTYDQLVLWVNAKKIRMVHNAGGLKCKFTPYQQILIRALYPVIGSQVIRYLPSVKKSQIYSWVNRQGLRKQLEPCDSVAVNLSAFNRVN